VALRKLRRRVRQARFGRDTEGGPVTNEATSATMLRCSCGATIASRSKQVPSRDNPVLTTGLAENFHEVRAFTREHRQHGDIQQIHDT
jgi:hypothetical protein